MNTSTVYISHWCSIEAGEIRRNGELLFSKESGEIELNDLLKAYYREKNLSYPKFFKMDTLSKLAFIGSEVLFENIELDKPSTDVGLVLSNSNSSLESDKNHCESISDKDNFYPSPAVFVYTLANICLAEISIRHTLQGENAFFISEKFDAETMWNYTQYMFETNRVNRVICGWVDYLDGDYKLVFYLVEKQGNKQHTIEELQNIFN